MTKQESGKTTPPKETETREELIAYCGLYCGDCFGYKGQIADMARDLRALLRKNKFDKVAKAVPFKAFQSYAECYECLGGMVKLRCKKGCRQGGGDPYCAIRTCCRRKELEGCWECGEFTDCQKHDFLKEVHGDAAKKNLRKLSKKGKAAFLSGKRNW